VVTHLLSCDWGTSSFRLRLVKIPERVVVDEIREPAGVRAIIATLPEEMRHSAAAREQAYSTFFAEKVELVLQKNSLSLPLPVVISGMASSTVGWKELPYAKTPFPIDGAGLVSREFTLRIKRGDLLVFLISGVATANDICRGEEMEIIGLMSLPEWQRYASDCTVILPGTHSKHMKVQSASLIDLRTFMTGELFETLSTRSILAASVEWPPPEFNPDQNSTDRNAFISGIQEAARMGLAASLFRTRTRSVLQAESPRSNTFFLDGLLVGAELSGLATTTERAPILLAASKKFAASYRIACQTLGFADRLRVIPPEQIELSSVFAHVHFFERFHFQP